MGSYLYIVKLFIQINSLGCISYSFFMRNNFKQHLAKIYFVKIYTAYLYNILLFVKVNLCMFRICIKMVHKIYIHNN